MRCCWNAAARDPDQVLDCPRHRIGAAEARAALTYRDSVAAQRKADAIPIPKLSERAEAAVVTLAAARGSLG